MMELLKDFWTEVKDIYKSIYKYIRFFLMLMLLFCSSLFKLIPIVLFKIDTENMSGQVSAGLTLFSNLVAAGISIFLYRKELVKQFKKLKNSKKDKLIITLDTSFRYWLIGLVVMIISNIIIGKLGIGSASNDVSVISMLESSPILAGISVIFLAPFIEEMVFRMAFKDIFDKKWLFVLISGIIFGSLHVIGSASTIYEYLYLIPYCSLGIAFSYIYQYSENIYISFLIHILHNSLTAFYTFLLAGVILW